MGKVGLSPKRHFEAGAELAAIRKRLCALTLEVLNAYPAATLQSRKANAAMKALDRLRDALEIAACREDVNHGQLGRAAISAYHPPTCSDQAYADAVARTGAALDLQRES